MGKKALPSSPYIYSLDLGIDVVNHYSRGREEWDVNDESQY